MIMVYASHFSQVIHDVKSVLQKCLPADVSLDVWKEVSLSQRCIAYSKHDIQITSCV